MLAIMFPGQGAQRRGMGKTLFDQFPEIERQADEILRYSIRELCVDDPRGHLAQTQYTQPAVFVVNVLSYLARQARGGHKPDYLLGHSLGEYNALWASGVFDFGTGLALVKRRAELMAAASGGGMAAVLGLKLDTVQKLLLEPEFSALDLANINTPKQAVLAGPIDTLRAAQRWCEAQGGKLVPLAVSAPFHSRHMEPAAREFSQTLAAADLDEPHTPVMSNVTAEPYLPGQVRTLLGRQLRSSVRWHDTVLALREFGVTTFEEVGPSDVLTRMLSEIPTPTRAERTPATAAVPQIAIEQNRRAPLPPPVQRPPAPAPRAEPRSRSLRSELALKPSPDHRASLTAEQLGSRSFREAYRVRLAYASGSMYRGIASEALVERMARAGLLSFFGTAGLSLARVEDVIVRLAASLGGKHTYGFNLLNTAQEAQLVELYLRHRVDLVEASAYVQLSEPLVRYRVVGLNRLPSGEIEARHKIVAKVSRPEIAEAFLRPAPPNLIRTLLEKRAISADQARWAERIPMADDLCIEADSGGHTDGGVAFVLLPTMQRLRDRIARELALSWRVRVGAAGGIGTPEAVLAAFVLGADFVLTGSINQCTVEAGQSDTVKDMLESIDVQDTDYAPAGDMFELGAQVQVLKRGVFFPSRANRLREIYRTFPSLEAIDVETRRQLEKHCFRRSFEDVFAEVVKYRGPAERERAEREPRYKMALVFKWYFAHTNQLAFEGKPEERTHYQVHCGPALGAFNQWVKGTPLERWRARHPDDIADRLMSGAASLLTARLSAYAEVLGQAQVHAVRSTERQRSISIGESP